MLLRYDNLLKSWMFLNAFYDAKTCGPHACLLTVRV